MCCSCFSVLKNPIIEATPLFTTEKDKGNVPPLRETMATHESANHFFRSPEARGLAPTCQQPTSSPGETVNYQATSFQPKRPHNSSDSADEKAPASSRREAYPEKPKIRSTESSLKNRISQAPETLTLPKQGKRKSIPPNSRPPASPSLTPQAVVIQHGENMELSSTFQKYTKMELDPERRRHRVIWWTLIPRDPNGTPSSKVYYVKHRRDFPEWRIAFQ